MKIFLRPLWLILWLLPAAATAAEPPIKVAVFRFSSFYVGERQRITDLIIAGLSANSHIAVLDRGQLNKILAEQALELANEIDPATAARVGRLTGASVIVTGNLSRRHDGGDYSVVVRIISTTNGRVFVERAEGRSGPKSFYLDKPAGELSRKIIETIAANSADFARPKGRAERIAEIVQGAKGGTRPTVLLRIAGPHVGDRAVHTTVETELGLILQRAGFVVVDDKSAQKPDVEVSGEATAELGARRGELFPSRATINLRARETATGKLLSLDRQAAEAIDIGEQTAIHSALEEAALELAARLVPLLSR